MSKVIEVLLYVVSAFFFYIVCIIAFVGEPGVSKKVAIMAGFSVPAILALMVGVFVGRPVHWQRSLGFVLVSAASLSLLVVGTIACIVLDSETQGLISPDTLHFFSDWVSGSLCIASSGFVGALLIHSYGSSGRSEVA